MSIPLKVTNAIIKSKPMKYLSSPATAGAATTVVLLSGLSKDGVNCYYYVTQSLKNEKIPEEKRKFVAALDLANGILNMITQTILGIAMIKPIDNLFDNVIEPKYFSNKVAEGKLAALKTAKKISESTTPEKFMGLFSRNKKWAKEGLKVMSTLIITQVIAKRIIVPLIATPMASVIKKRMEQKTAGKTPSPVVNNSKFDTKETPKCFKSFQ